MSDASDGNWVSLKEASTRAGVSISWLRKQYRSNGLPTRETVGPRGMQKSVPLDEVIARAAVFAAGREDGETPAPPPSAVSAAPNSAQPALTTDLLDRLFEAQTRAARAEAETAYLLLKLDDAYAEIDQLRSQLGE